MLSADWSRFKGLTPQNGSMQVPIEEVLHVVLINLVDFKIFLLLLDLKL